MNSVFVLVGFSAQRWRCAVDNLADCGRSIQGLFSGRQRPRKLQCWGGARSFGHRHRGSRNKDAPDKCRSDSRISLPGRGASRNFPNRSSYRGSIPGVDLVPAHRPDSRIHRAAASLEDRRGACCHGHFHDRFPDSRAAAVRPMPKSKLQTQSTMPVSCSLPALWDARELPHSRLLIFSDLQMR